MGFWWLETVNETPESPADIFVNLWVGLPNSVEHELHSCFLGLCSGWVVWSGFVNVLSYGQEPRSSAVQFADAALCTNEIHIM